MNITKALIEAGANLNIQNINGETAIIQSSLLPIIKMLTEAKADIKLKDSRGNTALDYANENYEKCIDKKIKSNFQEIIEILNPSLGIINKNLGKVDDSIFSF